MKEIVGACLSQFHDDENSFELLLAFADGKEVGHVITRATAERIAAEFANEFSAPPPPAEKMVATYVVWSNEHKCWWGPNHAGYCLRLEDAGRYTRDEALKICVNARGGRQFNSNPSEVPLPLEDAERFWPDDRDEWRVARLKHERPELWEDEE